MNTRTAYKYQVKSYITSIVGFYLVILGIVVVAMIVNTGSGASFSGLESATIVATLVMTISSVKSTFAMLAQNSVSRKKMFLSRVTSTLTLAGIMVLMDTLIALFFKLYNQITSDSNPVVNTTMYEMITEYEGNDVIMVIRSILFFSVAYTCIASMGILIGLIGYKISKTARIISISAIAALYFLLPVCAYLFSDIAWFLGKVMDLMFETELKTVISCIIITLLATAGTYIFYKKIDIRSKES